MQVERLKKQLKKLVEAKRRDEACIADLLLQLDLQKRNEACPDAPQNENEALAIALQDRAELKRQMQALRESASQGCRQQVHANKLIRDIHNTLPADPCYCLPLHNSASQGCVGKFTCKTMLQHASIVLM